MATSLKDDFRVLFIDLYPTESDRFSTKSQLVREMYEDIKEAQNNGVKLTRLLQAIKQKSNLDMSYGEFKQLLYRIRKERGETKTKTITTNTEKQNAQHTNINTAPLISNKRKEYDAICLKIAASEKGSHKEQYISYGGHFEDIQHQSDMATIHLLTRLKMAFHKKYDEFIE